MTTPPFGPGWSVSIGAGVIAGAGVADATATVDAAGALDELGETELLHAVATMATIARPLNRDRGPDRMPCIAVYSSTVTPFVVGDSGGLSVTPSCRREERQW